MTTNLKIWLQSEINKNIDIYDDSYVPEDYFYIMEKIQKFKFNEIYDKNDIDLININIDCSDKFIEKYETNKTIQYPGQIQFHVSYLFKKILLLQQKLNANLILPEIVKKNGEHIINNYNQNIFTIKDKKAFYIFCYDNTIKKFTNNSKIIRFPIVTKNIIGKINLKKIIKDENKKKLMKNNYEEKKLYTDLTLDQLYDCYDVLEEQYEIFFNFVNTVCEYIFKDYMDKKNENKVIFNKLSFLCIQNDIYNFFENLPSYKKLEQELKNICTTIENIKSEIEL
jgi:hypothetical protein